MEDKWCEIKMKGFQMGKMKELKKETGSRIWNDMSKRIRSQVKEKYRFRRQCISRSNCPGQLRRRYNIIQSSWKVHYFMGEKYKISEVISSDKMCIPIKTILQEKKMSEILYLNGKQKGNKNEICSDEKRFLIL